MKNFLSLLLLTSLLATSSLGQLFAQASSTPPTLQQYLQGLRRNGFHSFPATSRIVSSHEESMPFRRSASGVSVTAVGSHLNQQVSTVDICIANPGDMRQSERWVLLASASLGSLVPESSPTERLLALQRTIDQESYTFHNLTLTSSWQACGKTITITINEPA
jgi:hypothetical protein